MNSVKEIIQSHNRICWYPSAGADFRELLFLSRQYCTKSDVSIPVEELPDLFILTDCKPIDTEYYGGGVTVQTPEGSYQPCVIGNTDIMRINDKNYASLKYLYKEDSGRTVISVKEKIKCVEELDVPFDRELYKFESSDNYGKAFYFTAQIHSNWLGDWCVDVLYILAENTRFAFDYLVKNNVAIDFIVKVRYGDYGGESTVSGDWLAKLLKPLKTKYYLRNKFSSQMAENAIYEIKDKVTTSHNVDDDLSKLQLDYVHKVYEGKWSWQGDIYWYKVNWIS